MKKNLRIFFIVLGGLIISGSVGCHRNAAAGSPKTLEDGVAQLRASLISANPVVQSNLYQGVCYGIRYSDYARASSALQQIAGDPSLSDPQKQAVNEVSNLLSQAMANPQNATPPVH